MGAVISLFMTIVALGVVGVMSAIAASKSKNTEGEKWSIYSAIISFLVMILAFFIAVFAL